jgi:hypothetical protein
MLGKFFDWLGGGKREEEPGEEVLYKDYGIRPTARRDGGHWLTAGVITKTFEDGVSKEHHFIRAETHGAKSDAEEFSIIKGKKIIDEFGDRMFE